MNTPLLSIVVAFNQHRVIGDQGQISWHCPADLAYFKRITMGKPIIMGRKTHQSIGKPLPGRANVVLSRQLPPTPGIDIYASLDEAIDAYREQAEIMIIGGGELYRLCLPRAQRVYYTQIDNQQHGDTSFPLLPPEQWHSLHLASHAADARNPDAYHFYVAERIHDAPPQAKQ